MYFRPAHILATLAILGMVLSACGGGGSTAEAPATGIPAKTLSWSPPTAYTDGSPLNPVTDLDYIEVFVKENPSFSGVDTADAVVSAVDPATQTSVTSFNLSLLAPYLNRGVTYYVSVRAVTTSGMKSDFSASASFSL